MLSTIAIAQQTATPPAAPETTTTTTTVQDAPDAPPMTKREIKAQRIRQKQQEKAARAHAKAEKDRAAALKQDNKSTDATEKSQEPK